MLLSLPVEVLLQVMDQLTPTDLGVLCQMEELAHTFHYISDHTSTSSEDAFFTPHAKVKQDHMFRGDILVDTSRYYLIEVKGAQSLVVAEGKTQFTRRVISVTNQIDDFSLDIKSVMTAGQYQKKYVFRNFPQLTMRKLEIDPKMVEIKECPSVSIIDALSLDNTLKMKMGGVSSLNISNSHESVLENIDFATVPSDFLSVNFPKHTPMSLEVCAVHTASLSSYGVFEHLYLPNLFGNLFLAPMNTSYIDSLDAPFLNHLSISCSPSVPKIDKLHVPHLRFLDITEEESTPGTHAEETLMAGQYGIENVFANTDLWTNITNLRLRVFSYHIFNYTHNASNLQSLCLEYMCPPDNLITSRLHFPKLEQLQLIAGVNANDAYIPTFNVPHLKTLTITGEFATASNLNIVAHYPSLRSLQFNKVDIRAVNLMLGNSTFPHLDNMKLINTSTPPAYITGGLHLSAAFPVLTSIEIQLIIPSIETINIRYALNSPNLSTLICGVTRTTIQDAPFAPFERDPWNGGRVQPSTILSIFSLPFLGCLILKEISDVYLSSTPSMSSIFHGGSTDLQKLDCDASVEHLHELVYKNQNPAAPIQSVVCPCAGLFRKVVRGSVHPRAEAFTSAD